MHGATNSIRSPFARVKLTVMWLLCLAHVAQRVAQESWCQYIWKLCIVGPPYVLGVTSCPPSRTPYTRDLTIFYISTLSMLFDVCDQSCWQSCVTPVEIHVDVLALCIPVF